MTWKLAASTVLATSLQSMWPGA